MFIHFFSIFNFSINSKILSVHSGHMSSIRMVFRFGLLYRLSVGCSVSVIGLSGSQYCNLMVPLPNSGWYALWQLPQNVSDLRIMGSIFLKVPFRILAVSGPAQTRDIGLHRIPRPARNNLLSRSLSIVSSYRYKCTHVYIPWLKMVHNLYTYP